MKETIPEIPEEDIREMISESYRLISDSPSRRIYEAVKRIPYGHVATYAQVAEAAGDRKTARAVGNALHKNPELLVTGTINWGNGCNQSSFGDYQPIR